MSEAEHHRLYQRLRQCAIDGLLCLGLVATLTLQWS